MKKTLVLFWIIFFIGFILRIYNLSTLPSSLQVDEASFGYNAYNILTTGKDENDVSYPFYFEAKSPVPLYSIIPFIFLFGLNEFAIRLPFALYGLLGLVAIYLLTKELFKENKQRETIALFAMFFLAISPWDIHFSRIAWEMMPFIFFTTFGLFLFIKALQVPKLLPLAVIFLMLAFYSYHVAFIFIPIFVFSLCILYFRFFLSHKKETILSFLLFIILLIPFFLYITSSARASNLQQVSIFSSPRTKQTVFQHIEINYLQHFSLDFLFTKGDIGMPGQPNTYDSVRGMGELYLFQLPLILLGLYYLLKRKDKNLLLLIILLLLYPLGSIFTTRPSPLSRRSIIGVIPFQIISALGMVYFLELVKTAKTFSNLIKVVVVFVIALSFVYYLKLYFISYSAYSSGYSGFQYGSKQTVQYFVAHESIYDDLFMSPYIYSPYNYFNFYAPHDCIKCKTGLPDDSYNPQKKQLFSIPPFYMASHTEFNYIPVSYIYYPNGSLAFVLTQIVGKR